ncbi:hypothetical protein BDC45DRAFT_567436 [Circinella umbellata]|nr:hypothetical protein BDC45DRAFT_567436 [Circinella umbellata]
MSFGSISHSNPLPAMLAAESDLLYEHCAVTYLCAIAAKVLAYVQHQMTIHLSTHADANNNAFVITTASGKEIGSLAQYVNQCFLYIDNHKQELQQETLDNYGDTFTTN